MGRPAMETAAGDEGPSVEEASTGSLSRLEREQMRLLASHLPVVLPGSLVIAALLAWWFRGQAAFALSWFGAVLVLVTTRLIVVRRASRAASEDGSYARLKWLLLGGSLLSGLIWGLAGPLFFHTGDMPGFALLVIVLGGVVAGSLGPHSYYFTNYVLFAVPAMLPLLLVVFAQNTDFYTMVGIALLLFLLLNLFYSKQYEGMAVKSIQLQFSNDDLLRELEESNRQLHRYSYTDSLTGVGNRRLFDEELETLWSQALQELQPLSLLLLDVDHFKAFNDRHGHARGDEVLRNIAGILMGICDRHAVCSRPTRIGGEEFAILLQCDARESVDISHLLCREIEKRLERQGFSVTASIGVATRVPAKGDEPRILFQDADRNLYRAKSAGRNCVVSD